MYHEGISCESLTKWPSSCMGEIAAMEFGVSIERLVWCLGGCCWLITVIAVLWAGYWLFQRERQIMEALLERWARENDFVVLSKARASYSPWFFRLGGQQWIWDVVAKDRNGREQRGWVRIKCKGYWVGGTTGHVEVRWRHQATSSGEPGQITSDEENHPLWDAEVDGGAN